MKKDKLVVTLLATELLDDVFISYKKNLTDLSKKNNSGDPYSKMRNALAKLSNEEQVSIFNFIRLAMVDTSSVIFGTLDGSHFPPNIDGDFIVSYNGDEIQGSLQDELISIAEEKGIYK
ncbi:hypothetical protein [Proteus mirabilis]|uniref:hypothetical protein n=1 Tax=Proteus mirabilis TaxID=584 RepID=UPI0018C7FDC9|nr:hypothetical protein [Proteus mirabilis]MBG6040616.1 hypothetical protein [Proteus mirabilis]MCY9777980.1 hypothetical protein [Proteus mirabilis]MCY9780037.1 hypothetical protein [Proteus mirabilis]MCY9788484.1 hypothetical protein [Proteus mirabilis]